MGGGSSSAFVSRSGAQGATSLDIVTVSELDLMTRLNEGSNMEFLRAYAKLANCAYLLNIWDVIQDCEDKIGELTPLKYLCRQLMPHEKGFPMCSELLNLCNLDKAPGIESVKSLLGQIKSCCFVLIYSQIYQPFTTSDYFSRNVSKKGENEKLITHESFEYLNLIAKGGFGVVAQVRMKSTGRMYAMKVQPKLELLKQFRKDKTRITSELAASVVFDHPYLANIAYAFHTETLTMLVSEISSCGDLSRSLKLCPDNRMSADRVVFYAAEIISALMYLHRHDIMYRDLKPANVLLFGDGHIKLADFGSIFGMFLFYFKNYFILYNYFKILVVQCPEYSLHLLVAPLLLILFLGKYFHYIIFGCMFFYSFMYEKIYI